jgi:hypothetical protein
MKVDNLLKTINTWCKSKLFLSTLNALKDFVAIIQSSNGSLDHKTCHISNVIKPIAKAFVIGSNRKTNSLIPTPYSLHMCLI